MLNFVSAENVEMPVWTEHSNMPCWHSDADYMPKERGGLRRDEPKCRRGSFKWR